MPVASDRHHTDLSWVVLYIERWLKAPIERSDGTREERTKGTPQGGVISPLLANLFMHYAFDMWMRRSFPSVPFERFADDAVVHCTSEDEARHVLEAIRSRLAECGLELHPEKTRIVYCKDEDRRGSYRTTAFDFLGCRWPRAWDHLEAVLARGRDHLLATYGTTLPRGSGGATWYPASARGWLEVAGWRIGRSR